MCQNAVQNNETLEMDFHIIMASIVEAEVAKPTHSSPNKTPAVDVTVFQISTLRANQNVSIAAQ